MSLYQRAGVSASRVSRRQDQRTLRPEPRPDTGWLTSRDTGSFLSGRAKRAHWGGLWRDRCFMAQSFPMERRICGSGYGNNTARRKPLLTPGTRLVRLRPPVVKDCVRTARHVASVRFVL